MRARDGGAAEQGGGTGSAGKSSSHTATGTGDAQVVVYRVVAKAANATLCAGQCTMLSAQASGGVAPYTYRWDHDVPSGDRAQQVCPQETTTYTVTAHDSSVDEDEFAQKNEDVTDSVTVDVTAECADAGSAGDAGDPSTTGQPRELCRLHWSWDTSAGVSHGTNWDSGSTMAGDADGNMVVVGAFWGSVDFGAGAVTSAGSPDAFVAKLSSSCKLLWLKTFGGASAETQFDTVAIDGSGDIVVGGTLIGSADFGKGQLSTPTTTEASLLFKLDAGGTLLWTKVFPPPQTTGHVFDVGTDANNDIVISGSSESHTSFGGPMLGGLDGSSSLYIVKLDANGEFLWQKRVDGADSFAAIAVHGSGLIAVAGWGITSPVDFGDGQLTVANFGANYLAALDGDGKFLWGKSVDPFDSGINNFSGLWGGSVAIDANKHIALDLGDAFLDDMQQWIPAQDALSSFDADGAERWHRSYGKTRRDEYTDPNGWAGDLALDSHANLIKSQDFTGEIELAGVKLTSRGATDIFVQKVDADGNPVWLVGMGGALKDWTWSIATDKSDAIWVGYASAKDDLANTGDAVIVKLAP